MIECGLPSRDTWELIDFERVGIGSNITEDIEGKGYQAYLDRRRKRWEQKLVQSNDNNYDSRDGKKDELLKASKEGDIDLAHRLIEENNVDKEGGGYDEALLLASTYGHEEIVVMLIENGADVNVLRKDDPRNAGCTPSYEAYLARSYTPLIAASKNGHDRIISILLHSGADPNVCSWMESALYAASKEGHDRVVVRLLAGDADVHQLSGSRGDRESPLHAASQGGHEQCARWLLAAGADVDDRGDEDETPLLQAIRKSSLYKLRCPNCWPSECRCNNREGKHMPMIRLLVASGADVNLTNHHSGTPLMAAAHLGRMDTVECLLEAGADVNAIKTSGWTAITAASNAGHEAVVRRLLAEIEKKGEKKIGPALRCAAANGNEAIADLLIAAGADVDGADVVPRNEYDKTPLIEAVQGSHEKIVRRLIEAGADVNETYKCGEKLFPVIFTAADVGNETIIEDFLDAGATVDPTDDYRGEPFLIALYDGRVWTVKKYVQPGVDHYLVAKRTALFIASHLGHLDTVKVLVKRLSTEDTSVRVECMNRALPAAAVGGHGDVVKYLLEHGAAVDAHTGRYGTALQTAASKGHEYIVEKLLDAGADPTLDGDGGNAIYTAAACAQADIFRTFVGHGLVNEELAERVKMLVQAKLEELDIAGEGTGSDKSQGQIEAYKRILHMISAITFEIVEVSWRFRTVFNDDD